MKASSFSRSKAVVALGLCGFFAMAACSAGDPTEVETAQEASAGLTKGTVGAVNGDTDYCDSPSNLCSAGQGDCDSNAQCTTGNACATKYGPRYGLSTSTDVCMPASCRNNVQNVGETGVDCGGANCGPCYPNCSAGTNGSNTFCAQFGSCLCGNGQGNCNATAECQPGLACSNGKGAQFGFPAKLGLCLRAHCTNKVLDAGSGETGVDCGGPCGACLPTCTGGTPGAVNYCSTCLCTAGQGDCNNSYECDANLVCGSKNGAQFGFSAKTNVCVAAHCTNGVKDSTETGVDCGGECGTCPGVCVGAVGSETYCVGCKCSAGQGDCDASSECVTGLACGSNQGAKFGFTSSVDICVAPHCTNGVLDAANGETDVDCGGPCGNCLAASVDAGTLHACAVYLGGVKCWGDNASGQLGTGNTTASTAPAAVTGLGSSFTLVAAGAAHSCAVAGGNDVRCWGSGSLGQLGNGGTASSTTPVSVSGEPSNITQISAGGNTTCVLASGAVWCWGENASGQSGGTVGGNKTTPSQVPGITTAVHVSVGLAHACAALANGTVRCWGSDSIRQLGDNLRNNTGTPVTAVGVAGAIEVSAGDEHSCALTSDGTVYCWGNNGNDRLAIGAALNGGVPSLVNGASGGIRLASSGFADCIIKSGGTMACWGRGTSGQIGSGSTQTYYTTATAVTSTLNGFATITGGGSFFCAKNAFGVACWGDDNFGELGKGTIPLRATPTNISSAPSATITSIGAGDLSTCLVAGGVPYCFGNNNSGEIGDGTAQQRRAAKAVNGITTATEVGVGSSHACVVLSTGAVSCWGSNTFGQLGDGGTTTATSPVTAGATGASHVGAGTAHTCVLKTNGSVQCWGQSAQGQLGNGGTAQSNNPVTAVAANVIDLGVGQRHNCVVLSGGAVSCWGFNNASQVGDGTTTNQLSPVAVVGLPSAATRVAAGQNHSCAVLASGAAYCWGDNTLGQLGNSSFTSSATPVQVSNLTGLTDIMTWGSTTCALAGNSLYCWGQNSRGQVGNGTIVNVSTPYQQVGLNAFVGVGGRHTCAVRTNNSTRCWGYNDYGQVGDNTAWLFPTPAYVAF